MRDLVVLFIHLLATLVRLLGPGGVRSLLAESLLLKHQLLIVNRSRQRSPNLSASDRLLAGLLALLVRRLLRSAIALKPSTLLRLHKALAQADTGGDGNQVHPLRSPYPIGSWKGLIGTIRREYLVLDDGRSGKQAARFQDLLQ